MPPIGVDLSRRVEDAAPLRANKHLRTRLDNQTELDVRADGTECEKLARRVKSVKNVG